MIHNVVEEHVLAAYDQLRGHFPEFCGCEVCRGDVLVFALNRLPARYVATRAGAVTTELDLDKQQTRARIDVVLMEGFRKVGMAPRCGARPTEAPAAPA